MIRLLKGEEGGGRGGVFYRWILISQEKTINIPFLYLSEKILPQFYNSLLLSCNMFKKETNKLVTFSLKNIKFTPVTDYSTLVTFVLASLLPQWNW